MIRLMIPAIDETDLAAVAEAISSGFLVQGERVRAFESALAELVGVEHAIAVTNCTAALQLALLALEIGPGDAVAVASYSWPATANVIELCGARPVFVDVDPLTGNMDPVALARVLETSAVKAVLPVHAFGGMAAMDAIIEVAASHGLPVVEDAACALGAELGGRPAGAWGVMGCFSFHPRKAITTGEGGVITTNDAVLARTIRALRNHGLDPDSPTPDFIMPGFNTRMTEFQAALGLTQLQKFKMLLERRIAAAHEYDRLLAGSVVRSPAKIEHSVHVYQSYVVQLPSKIARDEVIAGMRAAGIETTIGTYHMPLTTYFRETYGFTRGDFPGTDEISSRALTLPLHHSLLPAQQQLVVETLARVVEQHAASA